MDPMIPLRVLMVGAVALCIGLAIAWCAVDARRRGKSAFLVAVAVFVFFPFGLVAWLLFRPPRKAVAGRVRPGEFRGFPPRGPLPLRRFPPSAPTAK
jgi:hypothetical protein